MFNRGGSLNGETRREMRRIRDLGINRVRLLTNNPEKVRQLDATNLDVLRLLGEMDMEAGRWEEALNSDSEHYGGSNVGNLGGVLAEEASWHGQPASGSLTLPPLAALSLRPEGT